MVELHGGTMWVESEVGVGSNFFFTLTAHRLLLHLCQQRLPRIAGCG
jgi:light-regulated signal transduction histidine kinase (bacteriophytochrome)